MKTMIKTIAKAAAKWLLGYLPDVALWAVRYGADKTADEGKVMFILGAVKDVATVSALVAGIMEDGKVTEQEALEVQGTATDLANRLKELL